MCMQSLYTAAARPERTMWIKAATSRTWTEHEHTRSARNGEKNLTYFYNFRTGDINIRSVAFCIIISIFLELCLVDYFTLLDHIQSLPLHHQCHLLHGQHPRMGLYDLWVLSWNLRRQWQSVLLELIEILCHVHLMSYDGFVHFQIY